mmetsp:Transcript_143169/g.356782  ORF Transcript_143169/g.356782 Transcript_143169/m.356782 type:complete len:282 (-) Transcript_143169:968-1813(-)
MSEYSLSEQMIPSMCGLPPSSSLNKRRPSWSLALPACPANGLQPINTAGQKQTHMVRMMIAKTSTSLARFDASVGLPSWKYLRRKASIRLTRLQKRAPINPVAVARTANNPNSHNSKLASLSGNSMKPEVVSSVKPLLVNFATTAATMVPRNARQVRALLQNDEASSKLNKMPPTGAPNAAATPIAAPCAMNSHLLRCPMKMTGHMGLPRHRNPSEKAAATMPPRCAKGPSVPAKSPAEVTKSKPIDRETKACGVKACGMEMPLRYALISGIPLPPACGAT